MEDWHPFPKQETALQFAYFVDELLYGGARGPGKSECGIVWLIDPDYIGNSLYRGLVIRRNAKDLSDWCDRAERMYARCGAIRTGTPAVFTFPSGAKIKTGHLRDKNAYRQYQGHEYHKILIEELTQIPLEMYYEMLLASCRSVIPGLKASVFATTNPDGPGHEWVKDRFSCNDGSMKIYGDTDEQTGLVRKKVFVPGNVEDNPYLMKNDPGYVAMLNAIKDDVLRKQWRDGSWEEYDTPGAYYLNQLRQATAENRITRIPVDPMCPVHVTFDLGVHTMRLWLFQVIGKEIRFIDFMAVEDPGLEGAMRELQAKAYNYGYFYFPHDIKAKEITSGRERIKTAESLGMRPYLIASRPTAKADGINAVKMLFPYMFFDSVRCKDGLWGLKNYTQVYNEDMGEWEHSSGKHWAAHVADSLQTMALVFKWGRIVPKNQLTQEYNIYNINAMAKHKQSQSSSITGYPGG